MDFHEYVTIAQIPLFRVVIKILVVNLRIVDVLKSGKSLDLLQFVVYFSVPARIKSWLHTNAGIESKVAY